MGRIGDIMRVAHGIEPKKVVTKNKEALVDYWSAIRGVHEKSQSKLDSKTLQALVMASINKRLTIIEKEFRLIKEQIDLIELIADWVTRSDSFLKTNMVVEPSLKKGFLIIGTCGTGKTLIMNAFVDVLKNYRDKAIGRVETDTIVDEFEEHGSKGIKRYSSGRLFIDELGDEDLGNNYGKRNVIAGVLKRRYNLFINKGIETHASSNITPKGLEELYGNRLGSRSYEMFNVVVLGGVDNRKPQK